MKSDKINIPIYVESRYKVNRKKIKESINHVLHDNGVVGPVEVSVAIVGDRKMRELNNKYRGLDKTTNVLSFSQIEGESSPLPRDMLFLGDIVISFPVVIEEAAKEEVFVDEKVCELVEHGLLHLLGQHHEE